MPLLLPQRAVSQASIRREFDEDAGNHELIQRRAAGPWVAVVVARNLFSGHFSYEFYRTSEPYRRAVSKDSITNHGFM